MMLSVDPSSVALRSRASAAAFAPVSAAPAANPAGPTLPPRSEAACDEEVLRICAGRARSAAAAMSQASCSKHRGRRCCYCHHHHSKQQSIYIRLSMRFIIGLLDSDEWSACIAATITRSRTQ